jgi:hypothetical protein
MHEKSLISMILSAILLASCVRGSLNETLSQSSNITLVTIEPGTALNRPLLSHWSLTQKPVIDIDSFKLIVLGFQLNDQSTALMYATIGMESEQLLKEYVVSVVSDSKQFIPLTQVEPCFNMDRLELGVMQFLPRKPGSNKLYLRLTPKSTSGRPSDVLFAEYYRSTGADEDLIPGRITTAGIDQSIDESGYQIGFKGWGFVPQTILSDEYGPTTPWIELPKNISVITNASFSIKNTQDGQTDYVALQLLSDGSAFAAKNGKIYAPERIILPAPTQQPIPYPGLESGPSSQPMPYPGLRSDVYP